MSDDELSCKNISYATTYDVQQIQERYKRELTEIKGAVKALLSQRKLTTCNNCNEIVQATKVIGEGTSPYVAVPIADLGCDNLVEFSEDSKKNQRDNLSHDVRGNKDLEGNNDNYLIFVISKLT